MISRIRSIPARLSRMALGASRRAKASSGRVTTAAARSTAPDLSASSESSTTAVSSRPTYCLSSVRLEETKAVGLLISWATLEASTPTAASLSACTSRA